MRFTILLLVATAVLAEPQISLFDMVPGVAQIKSVVQLIAGDKDGAARTQTNFLNGGIIPSQLRSGYFLLTGEPSKAIDIQSEFVGNLEGLVDGLPLVGHAKGVYHLLTDEAERGWEVIKSATSSAGTMIGAVTSGPVGAVGGHVLTDLLISGVDAAIKGNKTQSHGIVSYVRNFDQMDAGGHFDSIAGLALDAAGVKVGKSKSGKYDVAKARDADLQTVTLSQTAKVANWDTAQNTLVFGGKRNSLSEPGTGSEIPSKISFNYMNRMTNRMMMFKHYNFLKDNKAYNSIESKWTRRSVEELRPYTYETFLHDINIESLTSKLDYLTEHHRKMIEKNDFRLINTIPEEVFNCYMCSVGGILGIDVKVMQNYLYHFTHEAYDPNIGTYPVPFIEQSKQQNIFTAAHRSSAMSVDEFYEYLSKNYDSNKNKQLILELKDRTKKLGHTMVLKYTMIGSNPRPICLTIDFQQPPVVSPQFANPLRFKTYIDEKKFNEFRVVTLNLN